MLHYRGERPFIEPWIVGKRMVTGDHKREISVCDFGAQGHAEYVFKTRILWLYAFVDNSIQSRVHQKIGDVGGYQIVILGQDD